MFRTDGTFVKEFINRRTLGFGSAFESALSVDAEQRFLYNVDGMNQKVGILRRDTLEILTSFGQGGRYRDSSSRSTASRPILAATPTRARPSKEARAAIRLQGDGVGHSGEPGAIGSFRPDPRAAPNTFASSYGMVTSS